MTTPPTPQEYYASLPRKRVASAALIFDDQDRLLIVKPSYKEGWVLPGGVVDGNEDPYDACVREVMEEVGLTVRSAHVGGVAYLYQNPVRGDVIEIFWITTVADLTPIKIDHHEIIDVTWATREECQKIMRYGLGARTFAVWDAWKRGRTVYIQNDEVFVNGD